MSNNEEFNYVKEVCRSESVNFEQITNRLREHSTIRLLHAAIGMCTETGEIQDCIKKYLFYGREADRTNMIEELGDLMWYIGIACDVLHISFDEIQKLNIAKLRARYPEKFTEEQALDRDLAKERGILEQGEEYGRTRS